VVPERLECFVSAVDEIETAVKKLTQLRDASTAGIWRGRYYGGTRLPKQRIVSVVASAEDDEHGLERVVNLGDYFTKEDAALIITLHRTIDAQLAILRVGLSAYTEYISDIRRALKHDKAALALARAINGTPS
jgi:hypothetical protein